MNRLTGAIFLAAAWSACLPAVAALIDDFEVGSIVVERTGATLAAAEQLNLDQAHVLGGTRAITVGEFGGPVQRLTIDAPAGELRFTTDTFGYFKIEYGSAATPLNVDLTASGANALVLDAAYSVPQFPTATMPPNAIHIYSATRSASASTNNLETTTVLMPDGGRRFRIPLTVFGPLIDLTSVDRIELNFGRVVAGSSFALRDFATVPEPSGLALLLSAGLWRLFRRRPRPRRNGMPVA